MIDLDSVDSVDIAGPVAFADFGGSGTPIVCVHGLGGSLLNWSLVAPALARHGRVLAMDLPGFGRTPRAGRSARIGDQVRLVARFIARVVGGRRVILAGSSMGGLIALETAAAQLPLERLLLFAPAQPVAMTRLARTSPRWAFALAAAMTPALGELAFRLMMRLPARQQIDAANRMMCVDPSRLPRQLVEQQIALHEARARDPDTAPAFLEATRSVAAVLFDRQRFARTVAAVRVPTLIIHGRQDGLVPLSASQALVRSRPDFQLHVIEGAGHMTQVETPDKVVPVLDNWLGAATTRAA